MLQEDSNANWAEMKCRALIYTRAAMGVYCYRYCFLETKERMHNEVGTCAEILPLVNPPHTLLIVTSS